MGTVLFYDADCGFCTAAVRLFERWAAGRLTLVPIQDPRADTLLAAVPAERRLDAWHLVTEDGRVHTAGRGVAPLLALLPKGAPLAALARRLPSATDRLYVLVARHRGLLGRLFRVRPPDRERPIR